MNYFFRRLTVLSLVLCILGTTAASAAERIGLNAAKEQKSRSSLLIPSTAPSANSGKVRTTTKPVPKPFHRSRSKSSKKSGPFIRGNYVLTGYLPVRRYNSKAPTVVIVDKGSHFTHTLQLQERKIVRTYSMSNAIGKGATPSHPGRYIVSRKKKLPTWTPPTSIDPKQKRIGPYNQNRKNPLGVAAIYLNKFGILLHGTNNPDSIRNNISHGCVRHSNSDISRLYGMVDKGDVVYIVNRMRGHVVRARDFKVAK